MFPKTKKYCLLIMVVVLSSQLYSDIILTNSGCINNFSLYQNQDNFKNETFSSSSTDFLTIPIDKFSDYFNDITYKDTSYDKNFMLDNNGLTILAANLSLGAAFYLYDQELFDGFQKISNNNVDNVSSIFEKMGNGTYMIPLQLSTNLVARYCKLSSLQATTDLSLKSTALSSAIVLLTKYTVGRSRPYIKSGKNTYKKYKLSSDYHSFPSGHTAMAFTIATAFSVSYSNELWVKILSYSLATGVALSRVNDNKHWFSDVCIGAGVGYLSVKFVNYKF